MPHKIKGRWFASHSTRVRDFHSTYKAHIG